MVFVLIFFIILSDIPAKLSAPTLDVHPTVKVTPDESEERREEGESDSEEENIKKEDIIVPPPKQLSPYEQLLKVRVINTIFVNAKPLLAVALRSQKWY